MTSKERELLKSKLAGPEPIDGMVLNPFLQHVRQNHPDELRELLMPPDFLGLKDASWQMDNPERMRLHDRASVVLNTIPPKSAHVQPYNTDEDN